MGKNNSYSRRDFLKFSSWAASSLYLAGCASFRSSFNGDRRQFDEEIVILGAGAAGLAAAYTLKKNKVPFRVFEAAPRVGGRLYTLQNFAGKMFAEMGGEFFEESHRHIFQLCKELSLETQEIKTSLADAPLYLIQGKYFTHAEYRKKIKPLLHQLAQHQSELFSGREVLLTVDNMAQYEKAFYYDSQNVQDFVRSLNLKTEPWALEVFFTQVRSRYGVEPGNLSMLYFLSTYTRDPRLNPDSTLSRYRLAQGNEALVRTLYERVAGVIPDHAVKVSSPLISLRESVSGFELGFRIEGREQVYQCRHIICTLPFSILREVEGFSRLNFSALKKELIQSQVYAEQAKAVIEGKDRFWKRKTSSRPLYNGHLSGDFTSQELYDGGLGQAGIGTLVSCLRTDHSSLTDEGRIIPEALKDLEKIDEDFARSSAGNAMSFINWGLRSYQKGSRSSFLPGQYHRYGGVAAKVEYGGQFAFAGEHTSVDFPGTMEGAFATGIAAANAFIKTPVV